MDMSDIDEDELGLQTTKSGWFAADIVERKRITDKYFAFLNHHRNPKMYPDDFFNLVSLLFDKNAVEDTTLGTIMMDAYGSFLEQNFPPS